MRIATQYGILFFIIVQCLWSPPLLKAQNKTSIKITFINTVNKKPVVLNSFNYNNCWNESYTISKLKYYISNIQFHTANNNVSTQQNSYYLINEEDDSSKSVSISVVPANYSSISFLIGVDSLKNVSGAQTDALDPLNGMFWTWNTGYIMFKLEGNSKQSNLVNNKIAYHIGGFKGDNNVLRNVQLNFTDRTKSVKNKDITEINIGVEVDKIWNVKHILKISETPVFMSPGSLAASIADNYAAAFQLINIVQH